MLFLILCFFLQFQIAQALNCPGGQKYSPPVVLPFNTIPAFCIKCQAGQYKAGTNQVTACTACEPGKYNTGKANSGCSTCPNGWGSLSNRQACQPLNCPGGQKYSASVVTVAITIPAFCTNCPKGQYKAGTNQVTACTTCEPGKYNADIAQTSCKPCSTGWGSVSNRQYCEHCPKGRYLNTNSKVCTNCPTGRYTDAYGQTGSSSTACKACPNGYTTRGEGGANTDEALDCNIFSATSNDDCPTGQKIPAIAYGNDCHGGGRDASNGYKWIAHYNTLKECYNACARRNGCSYFAYGYGVKAYKCWEYGGVYPGWNSKNYVRYDCVGGWTPDDYNTYRVHGQGCKFCPNGYFANRGTAALNNKGANPSSSYPLGQCEGDCDGHSHCGQWTDRYGRVRDLKCQERTGTQIVPGCSGGSMSSNHDVCMRGSEETKCGRCDYHEESDGSKRSYYSHGTDVSSLASCKLCAKGQRGSNLSLIHI